MGEKREAVRKTGPGEGRDPGSQSSGKEGGLPQVTRSRFTAQDGSRKAEDD